MDNQWYIDLMSQYIHSYEAAIDVIRRSAIWEPGAEEVIARIKESQTRAEQNREAALEDQIKANERKAECQTNPPQ